MDILADIRNEEGEIPNENIAQANEILNAEIPKLLAKVDPPTVGELIMLLENFVVGTFAYHAAVLMDLAAEINGIWNLLAMQAGGDQREIDTERDMQEMVDAMTYGRLSGFYNLLKAKGVTDSGLIVPK